MKQEMRYFCSWVRTFEKLVLYCVFASIFFMPFIVSLGCGGMIKELMKSKFFDLRNFRKASVSLSSKTELSQKSKMTFKLFRTLTLKKTV